MTLTWDQDIGTEFIAADVNVASNNSDLVPSLETFTSITAGTVYQLTINLTGGGAGLITVSVPSGAIPATASTSASRVTRRTYPATLPPLALGSTPGSGPDITQAGGTILFTESFSEETQRPTLTITAPNIADVDTTRTTVTELMVAFTFNEGVNGFNQGTPQWEFVPQKQDRNDFSKWPKLGTWSGTEGNSTYQQTIEVPPDAIGKIVVFVAPGSSQSEDNEDITGPPEPGEHEEFFYNTTGIGTLDPEVNISTPPTTLYQGTTFTQVFNWNQELESGTFRTEQIRVIGATKGPLEADPDDDSRFTMELTLPSVGAGTVTTTVLSHRLVSTAALGLISRRQGPAEDTTESFRFDQNFTDPAIAVAGGTTICTITHPIRTNPNLDQALNPDPYGGAFSGSSDTTFVKAENGNEYIYTVVQMIKRRQGTDHDLSNINEAGAVLFEVDLTNLTCRSIRQWPFITIAGRSLVFHNNKLYWFEGSHYSNHPRISRNYPANQGKVFSVDPGSNIPSNEGVSKITFLEDPSTEILDRGYHIQTASPMISSGDNLYLISGFNGLESITSNRYPDGNRELDDIELETDIRNWSLLKYGKEIEQRIGRFNTNGLVGWDILEELCILTNSNRLFDKYGTLLIQPKGGLQAVVQSSAPNTIEYNDETGAFPQEGLISIHGEIVSYKGISGRQFLDLSRAQYGTERDSLCAGSKIHSLDAVIDTTEKKYNKVLDADIRDLVRQLYNKITITYGATKPYTYSDAVSINRYGEREYEVELPLESSQRPWVESFAKRFVDQYKDIHYLITVTTVENSEIDLGDIVFLKMPDRSHLNRACQVYSVSHSPVIRETTFELKTI